MKKLMNEGRKWGVHAEEKKRSVIIDCIEEKEWKH